MISLGLKLALSTFSKPTTAGPEAAYVAALTAAGATVTAPQQAAISTFMSGEIAAGRWDGIKRFYFPVWGVEAANAVCMKSLTSGTFSGAMTHGAGFITSTGGVLLTNTTFPALGITVASHHLACLSKSSTNTDFESVINAFPGASIGCGDAEVAFRTLNRSITLNYPFTGIYSYGGSRTSRYGKQRLSSGVSTDTSSLTVTGNFGTAPISLMGEGVGDSNFRGEIGAISLGTALTDAEDTAYTLNLRNLYSRMYFSIVTGLDWAGYDALCLGLDMWLYDTDTINYIVALTDSGEELE
jgi:hypothetical protein